LLLHCKQGSDRTGYIVAAYRMAVMNWTKEEAIREFKKGGYGYHEAAFPNIVRLLEALDIERLKLDIQ
jgi:tyrosine-protein phosphatase SIW14